VFLAGHVVNALAASAFLAVLVAALGMLGYGVPFTAQRTVAAVVTLVGALACCFVAFPFTLLVRKASAAVPMTIGLTLTLFFISGNFFPGSEPPTAIRIVADIFPVRHFFLAMLTAVNPNTAGAGFEWGHLAVLAIWAVAGFALGAKLFRWTPTGER
jgi:ABC-2 type transport system permease protein